jgi:hypothetical protein
MEANHSAFYELHGITTLSRLREKLGYFSRYSDVQLAS